MKKFTQLSILITLILVFCLGCHGKGPSKVEIKFPETGAPGAGVVVPGLEKPPPPPPPEEAPFEEGIEYGKVECPTTQYNYRIFNAFKPVETEDMDTSTKPGIFEPDATIGGVVKSVANFRDTVTNKDILISAVGSTVRIKESGPPNANPDSTVNLPILINDLAIDYIDGKLTVAAATEYGLYTFSISKNAAGKWTKDSDIKWLKLSVATNNVHFATSPRYYINPTVDGETSELPIDTKYIYFSAKDGPAVFRIEPKMLEGGCIEAVYGNPFTPPNEGGGGNRVKKIIMKGNHLALLIAQEINSRDFAKTLSLDVRSLKTMATTMFLYMFRETEVRDQLISSLTDTTKVMALPTRLRVINMEDATISAPNTDIPNTVDSRLIDIAANDDKIYATFFTHDQSKLVALLQESGIAPDVMEENLLAIMAEATILAGSLTPRNEYHESQKIFVATYNWDEPTSSPVITQVSIPCKFDGNKSGIPPTNVESFANNSRLILKGSGGFQGIYDISTDSINQENIKYAEWVGTLTTKVIESGDKLISLTAAMDPSLPGMDIRMAESIAIQEINSNGDRRDILEHQAMPRTPQPVSPINDTSYYPVGSQLIQLKKGNALNGPYGDALAFEPYRPDDVFQIKSVHYETVGYNGSNYIFQILWYSTNLGGAKINLSLRTLPNLGIVANKNLSVDANNIIQIKAMDIKQFGDNIYLLTHTTFGGQRTVFIYKLPLDEQTAWREVNIKKAPWNTNEEALDGRFEKTNTSGELIYFKFNKSVYSVYVDMRNNAISQLPDIGNDVQDIFIKHDADSDLIIALKLLPADQYPLQIHSYKYQNNAVTHDPTIVKHRLKFDTAFFYNSGPSLYLYGYMPGLGVLFSVPGYSVAIKMKLDQMDVGHFIDMTASDRVLFLNTEESGVMHYMANRLAR